MADSIGRVVSVAPAAGGGRVAIVEVDAAYACARCASGRGCGAGVFGSQRSRRVEAELRGLVEVSEGDRVAIHLSGIDLLPAAVMVYGWPLAGAATGSLLVSFGPWASDAVAAAGALLGLLAGALLARRRLRSRDCLARFRPVVLPKSDLSR